jgi:uncharacterized repeat protein (TIGR01451 family)
MLKSSLYFSSNNNIINNTAYENNQYGLFITSDSMNNNVSGNKLCFNENYDLYAYAGNFGGDNLCSKVGGGSSIVCSSCPMADLYITKSVFRINATGGLESVSEAKVDERFLYVISYGNKGEYKGRNVSIIDNIPINTVYIRGTANSSKENVLIQYSTDWGRSWVDVEPNDPSSVTMIRWVLGDVEVGETGNVTFAVRIFGGSGSFSPKEEVTFPTFLAMLGSYAERDVLAFIGFVVLIGFVAAIFNLIINIILKKLTEKRKESGECRKVLHIPSFTSNNLTIL